MIVIENTKRMKEKIKRNNAYKSKGRNIGQSKGFRNANSLYIIKKWKTINAI